MPGNLGPPLAGTGARRLARERGGPSIGTGADGQCTQVRSNNRVSAPIGEEDVYMVRTELGSVENHIEFSRYLQEAGSALLPDCPIEENPLPLLGCEL